MGRDRQKGTYREILEKDKRSSNGDLLNNGHAQRLPEIPASFNGSRGGFHMSQFSMEHEDRDLERGQI